MLDQKQSRASTKDDVQTDAHKFKLLKRLKPLKTLDSGQPTDFMCDIDTGICGPTTKQEEG